MAKRRYLLRRSVADMLAIISAFAPRGAQSAGPSEATGEICTGK